MANENKEQNDSDLNNITPVSIKLTGRDDSTDKVSAGRANASSKTTWLIPLVSLLIVAGGVFFILPRHVTTPIIQDEPEQVGRASVSISPPTSKSATPEISPFQQAQEARQRNRSQDLLSEILKIQEELEEKNVLVWGADRYNAILDIAREGDNAYRNRDFEEAADTYAEALSGLREMLAGMDGLYDNAISKADAALNEGLSSQAMENYEFALLIRPGDAAALKGIERAKTINDVLSLITRGNDLQQNGQFEEAREKYTAALELDQYATEAREQIKVVNQRIKDRDFNRVMSEGYRHLQNNELENARAAFQRARRLKPDAAEVASALNQTQAVITNQEINSILARAVELENQEKWDEAAAEYEKALAIDENLAQAQEGRYYSRNRANLDSRFREIIEEPGRLSNRSVYEETRLLVQQASTIAVPESRLSRQLDTINQLMADALEPVQVIFASDNMTEVTLYKVGSLGKFEEKSMTLLPGSYVAVGTREGYRDVRVEFNIQAGQTPGQTITVTAIEKIASR